MGRCKEGVINGRADVESTGMMLSRIHSSKRTSTDIKHELKETILCEACRSNGKHKDGSSYCMTCKHYLCYECTSHHYDVCQNSSRKSETEQYKPNNFRPKSNTSSKHTSSQRFSARQGILTTGISSKPVGTFSTRCTKHPEYELDSFCQEHEVVVCTECTKYHHEECFVIGVEEAARGMCEGPKLKIIVKEFYRLQDSYEDITRHLRSVVKMKKEAIDNRANSLNKKTSRKESEVDENNEEMINLVEEMVSVEKKLNIFKEVDTCIALALRALENALLSGNGACCFVTFHTNKQFLQIYGEKIKQINVDDYGRKGVFKSNTKKTVHINETAIYKQQTFASDVGKTGEQPKSGRVLDLRNDSSEYSEKIKMSDQNNQKSDIKTKHIDMYMKRTSTSESRRKFSPTVRITSGQSRGSAKSGKSMGSITHHFDELDRILVELERGESNPVLKVDEQETQGQQDRCTTKIHNDNATIVSGTDVNLDSDTTGLDTNDTRKRNSSTKHVTAQSVYGYTISEDTDDLEDFELSSMYGADEIQPLFDNSQLLSDISETEFDYSDGIHLAKLNPSHLVFLDTKYIRLQSSEQNLLSGKRLTLAERMYTNSQTRHYVSIPDTRLVIYEQINIKSTTDSERVQISAIDTMPDGRIIVCDAGNKSVKLVEASGYYQSCVLMRDAPFAVASLSNTLVGVLSGLAFEQLYILSVAETLVVRKTFHTNFLCRDIASFESNIYLLCLHNYETEIMIMSIYGVVNTRICIGNVSPQCIAINPTSGVIYVTDERAGVSAFEKTGTHLFQCVDNGTERYHGLACDLNDHVFVTTEIPTGVHEMTRNGQYIVPLLLWKGDNFIRSICYSSARNDLILGFQRGDVLTIAKVFDNSLT